ncbi:collagen alpha-1(XXVII) chain A-like, partial [Osmerus eperlanus]|uniref:collagen alpha-1(XXVII) chain A-like n=1 Tax=Osmerus eperlanus TaxID=29151 RepID=UPI002E1243E5
MNLGTRRRDCRTSHLDTKRALLLCTVLYCTCYLGLAQVHPEDVDILQRLGLQGDKPPRSVPPGVIPFRSGVILTQRARLEAPLRSVIPPPYWPDLALLLSFRSHRVNSAFLFTVLSGRRKLLLGLQLSPGRLVLHTGPRTSVSLPYDPHDGQWHHLALDVSGRTATLYAACGGQSVHADLVWDREDGEDGGRDPQRSSFLLGKVSQQASVHFEGAVCQLDLVPSAQAAHNYCKYIKKQCREADTYRPNLPPLLPLIPRDPNTTATRAPLALVPPDLARKPLGLSPARSAAAAASAVRYVAPSLPLKPTTPPPQPLPGTVATATARLGLVSLTKIRTQTVTVPLRTGVRHSLRTPTPKPPRPTPAKSTSKKTTVGPNTRKPAGSSTAEGTNTKKKPDMSDQVPGSTSLKKPKPTPAKKSPPKPKATPAKVPPSKVAPSKVAPSKLTPSKVAPSKVAPSKLTPSKVAPSKVAPSKVAPSKLTPFKTTSSKSTTLKVTKSPASPKQPRTTKAPLTPRSTPRSPYATVTLPATDGFQTWDVEPTYYSLLDGALGLKGEPGLP